MRTQLIPYGADGWREKLKLIDELLAEPGGPPFLYNDVLVLVPSSRLRRTYGRLVVERALEKLGTATISPPDIRTLHQLLQHLHARSGGRPLIDENSRLVLVEGIVKERMASLPFADPIPDTLAPSLAAAVADMIEELGAAGIGPERLSGAIAASGIGDKRQVALLEQAYCRYQEVLSAKGLNDPAAMIVELAENFDPAWLARYRRVIVDGLHDAGDLQARVLRKIALHEQSTFLIEAPGADLVRNASDQHPLRLIKEFCARLGIMLGEDRSASGTDAGFLAAALFADRPFGESAASAPPSFAPRLDALSGVTMREEVSLIAGRVKDSLRSGTIPDSVLVAFPSLDEYGPLVEEIFRDYGIPYNRALGRQLSTSAVATALVSLLQTVQDNCSGRSLLRVLSSPFLKFSEDHSVAPAFERLMRGQRILDGREQWLKAARTASSDEKGRDILSGPLQDLFTALDPFFTSDALPLSGWMERAEALLRWSGMAERVALIKGPLNVNLQSFKKLSEVMASLSRAGRLFPEYRYSFDEWSFLLRKTFMHARFQVPPDDEGGVQVLGLEESASHAWSEIYLGGLIDGKFPQRLPQNIFLPEATLETLGVRPLEQARMNAAYHFYRLLLSAPRVTLTWPENQGDRPVVASPFLAELKPLEIAGLLNRGMERTRQFQFSLRPEDARSVAELAKAIAVTGAPVCLDEVLRSDMDSMPAVRSAYQTQPSPAPAAIPIPGITTFSVTDLDVYLNCPYDYYVKKILGIEPLEEVTEDISPSDRGSRVHAILKRFYEEWQEPVTSSNLDQARGLLLSLSEGYYKRDADTFRNRREKDLFVTTVAERFLTAETGFWTQGFRPFFLEQRIDDFTFNLGSGREFTLTAKIDRIDVDDKGNFVVVDYKTGKYPQPKMGPDQEIFQLPVYACMAIRSLAGRSPALGKPVGLAYYDLAGKFGNVARDVVLYDKDAGFDQPAVKPKASPRSTEEFNAILDQSMRKAAMAIEGIVKGDFSAKPLDKNRCMFCANEMMCGKEPEE
ncbi:MAG: PD-(D/E)XK nuclease family protein [Nitrospirota bacterium]|nr:PD-(D/E)XK nuclease family protein [Nitrospirota bacterium]